MTLDPIGPKWGQKSEHSGQETIFGVCPDGFGLRWDISGHPYRGFAQNFDTFYMGRVVWPGEPFWEEWSVWAYFQDTMFFFLVTRSQDGFYPKSSNQKGTCKHKHLHMHRTLKYWKTNHFKSPKHIHMHIHIQIHIPYMGPGGSGACGRTAGPAGPM